MNLILVAATTNGFTFQIIDSLVQSRGYARPGVTVKSGSTGRNRFTFCCLMLGEADHQQDPPVEGILILAVVTK